jgi:hypothetical protein
MPWFKLVTIHVSFKEPCLFLTLRWRGAWIFQIFNWRVRARAGYEVFRTYPVRAEVVVSLSSHPLDIYLYILSKNQPGFGSKSNIHTTLAHTLRTSIFKHIELGGSLQVLFKKETWTSMVLCFLSNKSRTHLLFFKIQNTHPTLVLYSSLHSPLSFTLCSTVLLE